MAKKKKNRQTSRSAPSSAKASSFGSGALAEQLARAKATKNIKKQAKADARRAASSPPPKPKPEPLPPEELLDGEELFKAALDAMPAPSSRHKKRGSSAFHGDFARQLQGHTPIEQRRQVEPEQDTPAPSSPPEEPLHDATPLEGDDLFAHAVNTMQPEDLFAGKYHGSVKNLPKPKKKPAPFSRGDTPPPKRSRKQKLVEEAEAREKLDELREELTFTRAVGGFDMVFDNQDKYHRQKPRTYRDEEREAQKGYSSESPEGMITPPLPKSGEGLHHVPKLDPSQRGLINRARLWARKNQMEVLNIRGDGVEDALRQVELFMHQHWKDGARYVRIVHGRGLQSEDGVPVLKPSVLHWLEGPGFRYVRGYAPELTQDKDYGSLIVCLTQRDSRDKE